MTEPTAQTTMYAVRAAEHASLRDAERRRSAWISRLRLTTFLAAAALLVWALSRPVTPWPFVAVILLFAIFGVLVVWHARVEARAAWQEALRLVHERAIARIERRWDDLPAAEAPSGIDLTRHAYALDLDLFGRASLFQWLGPAATPTGGAALAAWLLAPARAEEIHARQAAVAELASQESWRAALAAHGVFATGVQQPQLDRFLTWAEGEPALPAWAPLQAAVWLLTGSIWLLLGLFVAGILDAALFLIPMFVGIVLSFALSARTHDAFDSAGAGQQSLGRYADIFEHATARPFESPLLRALQARLSAGDESAPSCMRRLNRILGFADLRAGAALLHFPIQSLTLWDFHVLFALDRWRRATGGRMRGWMTAVGDLDALSAFGGCLQDNPDWSLPEIAADAVYAAESLGHPLLRADRRVSNDVQLGPPGTLLLVTGSNMSGKSTLLRAIGLNAVLAQAGGCVCARRLRLPPSDLQTSIRVQDSLELGLSYFMAALARLKGVVDAAERPTEGRVLLYLLDEILQGTNSAERGIAVLAVARHLLAAPAIGAMTTHDLNLAGHEPLSSAARLVHFTETVDEAGQMRFDYHLRDGLATSRNALRLMQLIGIDL